ncbi:S9 family peptidase [Tenacibaculum jejuense]|uniref:Dipeptidyl aminopeptidase IV n=1 Tax=Tenacibaculum jejuense TaxID=584609 RepID=A0A238U884_9FLAO|nr:S9 family peptidase [Tenacibaculum jejuense]SNR14808.1 Dipeptidyl aminopeptidase IV [Tenacibaculum jejuense]
MKKICFLVILVTFFSAKSQSTTNNLKEITLEEIWNGSFSADRMNALRSMNGDFYTVLGFNRETRTATVDKYSYETQQKVETIVDGRNLPNLDYFSSYSFNDNETKLLLGTNFKQVYRHSYKGTYFIYDIATKDLISLGEDIQEPTFSPDSKKVAYAKDNNLYVRDLEGNREIRVTNDGKINAIINGTTDWVYEEEFAFVKAFEWSKDSKFLAFLRFDEKEVAQFTMNVTGNELYPSTHTFKYPKAGEKNAVVTLELFNVPQRTVSRVDLGSYEYIPRMQWTNKPEILSITTLNRNQNDLKLFFFNANTGNLKVVLNEKDEAYVDVQDNLTFLEDNSFIWTSERDGYNHIYHYNEDGTLKNQITKGDWDVTNYYGLSKTNNKIYYQSVENGSINRGVYAIGLDGSDKKLLTDKSGQSSASFSKNMKYFINTHSSATQVPTYTLYNGDGKKIKTLKDNIDLYVKMKGYKMSKKEFFTYNINGNDLNMWMIKPADFDPTKKYPLLLFQYSGPGSQQVSNRWNSSNDYWHQMLAQKGIIVACVDGRGTGYKGRDFKKVTQKELGKYEVEDQIAVAKFFANENYIDAENIGIWGWSYGGFMSTNCLLKGNDVFSMAIAVAPVTSWRFYDTVYTERYMTTPQENASGYDENSPISHADKLKGDYLLVHGSGDDNVHVQNTMRMVNALVEANKQFDLFIYPDRTHGIYRGKNTRLNLYTKMTNFVLKSLKN